jgi:hypothetical protein
MPALTIEAEDGIVIALNKDKFYRVLAQKDLIVAGLNKKLIELIQKHLEAEARNEMSLEKEK